MALLAPPPQIAQCLRASSVSETFRRPCWELFATALWNRSCRSVSTLLNLLTFDVDFLREQGS